MLSTRLSPRPSVRFPVSSLCLLAVPFRRSVFRVSPFFVSWGGASGGTGVELVGKSGRRSVAWSVRVCSLVVVVCLSVPLYQFPGKFPMLGRLFQGVLGCLLGRSFSSNLVRFCPLLCVLSPFARLVGR